MQATCQQCGTTFEARSEQARLCGPTCRQRASRAARNSAQNAPQPPRIAVAPDSTAPTPLRSLMPTWAPPATPPAAAPPSEWPLVTATRRELDEAGVLDTVAGHLALELAAQVCASRDTGSAKAAASKEFRAVMADALKDVGKQADSLDELASRRLKRASGA